MMNFFQKMKTNKRYRRDNIFKFLIYLSASISLGILLIIIGFIFKNGFSKVNWEFIKNDYESSMNYVTYTSSQDFTTSHDLSSAKYGFTITEFSSKNMKYYKITSIQNNSPLKTGKLGTGEPFIVKSGFLILNVSIDGTTYSPTTTSAQQLIHLIDQSDTIIMKISDPGGGIFPLIISTLILIILTLLIALPIGVLAAIYLVEYAKPGKMVSIIRFAIETLTGIPSIIYGIFGMLLFVRGMTIGNFKLFGFGTSQIAGASTLSILLLPFIIRTTEETLKTVPLSYKEGSYGLGANRIQTLWKIILPSSIPGILVGVILSVGRIVGESAALLFTIGTFAKLPIDPTTGNYSIFATGTSLTVRAYIETKEYGNIAMACAIGVVILIIVFILNLLSRFISKKLSKANY